MASARTARLALIAALAAASCAPAPQNAVVLVGEGYRAPGDPCRIAAETAFTNRFLDDSADLVACPEGMENRGIFPFETGGVEVARAEGFVLYRVPRR